jgi:hypothetical protein
MQKEATTMKRFALPAFAPGLFVSGLLVSGLVACGGGNKTNTVSDPGGGGVDPCADPCGGDDPCSGGDPCAAGAGASASGIDWSTWESWAKVNKAPFVSKGHKKPWVNVYVTPDHLEAYKAGSGAMPEGFAVVKSVHDDDGGSAGPAKMLTVMAKMGSDYDPENDNWYYAAVKVEGMQVMKEGKLEACINCHSGGEDYLYSSKVVGN